MRLLADENFPAAAVDALREASHDTVWIRTASPGISDDEVLSRARDEQRVLLTFDKDFGELVFQRGREASHGVVLFRTPLPSPEVVARLVVTTLATRADWTGRFSVVEHGRVRMRDLR